MNLQWGDRSSTQGLNSKPELAEKIGIDRIEKAFTIGFDGQEITYDYWGEES